MSAPVPVPPGWWATVRALLRAARVRAVGRRRRQRELTGNRLGRSALGAGALGFAVSLLVALLMSAAAAYAVAGAVRVGQELAVERRGLIPAHDWFIERVANAEAVGKAVGTWPGDVDFALRDAFDREAAQLAGTEPEHRRIARRELRDAVRSRGSSAFVPREEAVPGLAGVVPADPAATLGSLALLVWLLGLVFVGEGLELDAGRRRHPMWEWLFSHPVRPSAVFAAEMLAPIAANPVYWTAPIVPWVLYAQAYGAGYGLLAALLVGVPVAIATAATGKAIEVAAVLRTTVRSRGAVIGFMTWLGTAASSVLVFAALGLDATGRAVARMLEGLPIPTRSLPWLGWFLGEWGGELSFPFGIGTCLAASVAVTGAALASTAWSTARGLAGMVGRRDTSPARRARFGGRNALFRKELAWFTRDRSALVQVVLVPATMAALQLVNLHGFLAGATSNWHLLCAAGILFGTYFLAVVGPKSLASEGGTLWLAMSWPHGLEALLRAKARLWTVLASLPALGAMTYAAFLFPGEWWKLLLVAVGWCVFAWSMALKAVTLARVAPESGETEKIPAGRRWAVQLGTLSFVLGIMTREIGPAVAGIAFSVMTAAAMWQNFRARLPFLLDPWSERLPQPPTLMHATIAISVLAELGAVLIGTILAVLGQGAAQAGFAVSYGLAAIVTSMGAAQFLRRRGVALGTVWRWAERGSGSAAAQWRAWAWGPGLLAGIGSGLLLGLLALAYLAALEYLPWAAEALRGVREAEAAIPGAWASLFIAAVLFAPAAEEFLFRGLLFRALARDWPGWRAVAGSALFFASYHPVLSWLPVGAVGVACALLFRRTGRLANSVALHATYNAVVLGGQWLA